MYSDQALNIRQDKSLTSGQLDKNSSKIVHAKPFGLSSNWSFDGILLVLYYCWHNVHVKDRITVIHCLAKALNTLILQSRHTNSNFNIENSLRSQGNIISNLEFGSPEDAIYRFLIFCLTKDSSRLSSLNKLAKEVSDAIHSKGNPIKTWRELAKLTSITQHKIECDNTLFSTTVSECKRVKDISLLIVSLQLLYALGTDMCYLDNPIKLCLVALQRIFNRIEGNRGCYHEFDDSVYFRDAITIVHALRLLNYGNLSVFRPIFDFTISRHKDCTAKENYVHVPLITLVDCSQAAGALSYAKQNHKPMILTLICNVKIGLHKLGCSNDLEYREIEMENCCDLCPDCQNEIQQSYQGDATRLESLANEFGMSAFSLAGKAGILCDRCSDKLSATPNGNGISYVKKQPTSLWKSLHKHLTQISHIVLGYGDQELSNILNKTANGVAQLLRLS